MSDHSTAVRVASPAIAGSQFKGTLKQIAAACGAIGFARIFEVAGGNLAIQSFLFERVAEITGVRPQSLHRDRITWHTAGNIGV